MIKYAWLQEVCSVDSLRVLQLGHPWTMQRADGPWTVASDGMTLAARQGDFGFPPANVDTPDFDKVMRMPQTDAVSLPLTELRALALPWLAKNLPKCATCDNTGEVKCDACDGDGGEDCECECGDEHFADCRTCKGSGFLPCADCPEGAKAASEIRPVWIGPAVFDLRRFATLLAHIGGDSAQFRLGHPEKGGFFEIGDWLVIVMPLRPGDDKYKDAPRIELSAPVIAGGAPTQEGA